VAFSLLQSTFAVMAHLSIEEGSIKLQLSEHCCWSFMGTGMTTQNIVQKWVDMCAGLVT
jgi:hypothetical protein